MARPIWLYMAIEEGFQMIPRLLVSFCLLIFVFGCSTTPVSNYTATIAPQERIIDSRYLTQVSGTGQVTIKRDSGFLGVACSHRIFVDGLAVADIRVSEKIVLYLPEGEHILSASPNNLCAGTIVEIKVTIKADTEQSFRIGFAGNGGTIFTPTAF